MLRAPTERYLHECERGRSQMIGRSALVGVAIIPVFRVRDMSVISVQFSVIKLGFGPGGVRGLRVR